MGMKPRKVTKELVCRHLNEERRLLEHLHSLKHGDDYCGCSVSGDCIQVIDADHMLVVQ